MNPFDLAKLSEEKGKLEEQMGAEGFWEDVENANKVNQRMKVVSAKLEKYDKLARRADDLETLIEMADEENDESLLDEIGAEHQALTEAVEALKLETLLKGPYDAQNAVLSLHAGAGGTEAQDWVSLLYRMYTRYCEKHGFTVKVIDLLDGEEAGIKSVTFEVGGDNAYGYLKAEKGVHRLVRISPFDSSGRRHTSFASLDVTPIFDDDSNDVEIDADDLRQALDKLERLGGQKPTAQPDDNYRAILRALGGERNYKSHFLIPAKGDRLIPIETETILYFHIANGQVKAVDDTGREHLFPQTLDELADALDPRLFFRANRQFLIAKRAIREASLWFNGRLSITLSVPTPERIIISKARAAEFKAWF